MMFKSDIPIIHLANKRDAAKIASLVRISIKSSNDNDLTQQQAKAWIKSNSKTQWETHIASKYVVICSLGKKLMGVGSLFKNELTALYVHPSYFEKGVGSKILNHLEEVSRKNKVSVLSLYCSKKAVAFYFKKGYKAEKESKVIICGVLIPVTKMKKNITQDLCCI